MKTILLDTSIDYTSWDINEAGSIEMTEWQPIKTAPKDGAPVQIQQHALIDSRSLDPDQRDALRAILLAAQGQTEGDADE